MKINKIGDGKTARYQVRYKAWGPGPDGKRVVKSRPQKTFPTRREAQDFVEGLATTRRTDRNAGRKTFAEYAETWLATIVTKGRKRSTIDGYRSKLTYALDYFAGTAVADITPLDAANFMLHLSGDRCPRIKTPRSVITAWHPFRATMRLAARQGAIDTNPALAVDLPGQDTDDARQAKYHFLRPEEVERITDALRDRAPYDLLVRFDAYTGLRRGEIAGLDVRHVRLARNARGWSGRVRVEVTRRKLKGEWIYDTPKSHRARWVPLPGWLAAELHSYLTEVHPRGDDPAAPLFPNRKPGATAYAKQRTPEARRARLNWDEPVEPAAFYRNVFKPAVLAAGLPVGVRFHDLRHTYVSLLAANGVRPEVIAKLVGHKDGTITMKIYTHLWPEHLDEAVEGLSRTTTSPRDDREGGTVIALSR